jgi:hypothetical protein
MDVSALGFAGFAFGRPLDSLPPSSSLQGDPTLAALAGCPGPLGNPHTTHLAGRLPAAPLLDPSGLNPPTSAEMATLASANAMRLVGLPPPRYPSRSLPRSQLAAPVKPGCHQPEPRKPVDVCAPFSSSPLSCRPRSHLSRSVGHDPNVFCIPSAIAGLRRRAVS